MGSKAVIIPFTGTTTPISSYDETKINIGTGMRKYTGANPTDKFIGPAIIGLARPMEQTVAVPAYITYITPKTNSVDYIYYCDGAAGAATRRIGLYEFDKTTSVYTWKGFVTVTLNSAIATAATIRGFTLSRLSYTTGTVDVAGTVVTGSGTAWVTNRISAGCRIGFGTTDPKLVTTWYEITSITGETTINLTSTAGTISAGTTYVIDDTMIVMQTTNATAANGGLFVVKGINPDSVFTGVGTAIASATTIDNIRACYWLADAATVLNTISCGIALDDATATFTDHKAYVVDATANPRIFVYNVRKNLTLAAGKDITSWILTTGIQAVSGTVSQNGNGLICTMSSGPGSGIKSLYFVTTTRIYRVALSGITSASTTWQSDFMTELTPGGINTFALMSTLSNIAYISDLDKFILSTTNNRAYVTAFSNLAVAFDHLMLNSDNQLDQSAADSRRYPKPAIHAISFIYMYSGGILHMCRVSTGAITNQIYSLPIICEKQYALTTSQLIVTPSIDISDAVRLYNINISHINSLGDFPFQLPTEPFDVYYRLTGINDNTGVWTKITDAGDLSLVTGSKIQFAIACQIIGGYCIPARIMGVTMTYEDLSTDSHYEPSVAQSVIASNRFAYRQKTAWGSAIPNLRIRLYNATGGTLLIDDTVSASAFGTWEYSTDGGSSWLAWNSAADAVANYIRYTATSLPASTKIRVLLTQ